MSGRHRAGEQSVQQLEILQVNGGAVVKNLVATAFSQLAFEHQCAVNIQFYMTGTNVKILKEKQTLIFTGVYKSVHSKSKTAVRSFTI